MPQSNLLGRVLYSLYSSDMLKTNSSMMAALYANYTLTDDKFYEVETFEGNYQPTPDGFQKVRAVVR